MALEKTYDPKTVQAEITQQWDAAKLWHAEPDARTNRFSVVIPPPNVTGALHLGHAINNTLQDILVRCHRMRGDNTVWLPGTDHAGIATQTVVDKRLQAAGEPALKEYKQIEATGGNGREQFLAKVDAWKTEYEARILGQLKAMGASCDWDRTAFTMDEPRSRAVREAFFQLFKAGLIYRGKRLVNWDPVTQTALADDEVENEEVDGFFYYLRYPIEGAPDQFVTVATTRPETMLGDTAVAVNPNDPRAAALRGRFVRLPIVDRVIPIIEDDYVVLPIEHGGDEHDAKARMSSGFLKVTPAHDPNDYTLGQKHKLAIINVMAPDASISLDHGWGAIEPRQKDNATLAPFLRMTREVARDSIVAWFREHDLLEKQTPYRHSIGHSYRSHAAIEPYLSDQWYCRVTDDRLAGAANRALAADQQSAPSASRSMGVPPMPSDERAARNASSAGDLGAGHGRDGHATGDKDDGVRFFPERYAKTYETWHDNLRDWCISRQLWWGHRIPVWSRAKWEGEDYSIAAVAAYFKKHVIAPACGSDEVLVERVMDRLAFLYEGDRLHLCIGSAEAERAIAPTIAQMGYAQDPDVLDTWFSSALWPLSTLGWPDADAAAVDYWNPTSVLATGRDIITLWVSRMVMFNQFLAGRVPFRHVYINPTIQDGQGQRMSKSLGNGVDPLDVIDTHGADAMRFTLASMATTTQDVKLPVDLIDPHTNETFTPTFVTNAAGYSVAAPVQEHKGKKIASSYGVASGTAPRDLPVAKNTSSKFDLGRNFSNKLWNAARFVLMQIGDVQAAPVDESKWSTVDRWILSRLARTVAACDEAIDSYRFDLYAKACYDFVWRDFCDWYLEASKPAMKDPSRRESTARTLATCLDVSLRLMHPMIPFITEKLWSALNETNAPRGIDDRFPCDPSRSHAMTSRFPASDARMRAAIDEGSERVVDQLQQIVGAIRQLRNDNKADPKKRTPITLQCGTADAEAISANREFVEGLGVSTIEAIGPDVAEPADAAKTTAAGVTIFVAGIVDAAAGEKRKAELMKIIGGHRGRLSNESYLAKAPAKLVEETRSQLAAAEAELARL